MGQDTNYSPELALPCTPLAHGFTSPKAKLWVTQCCSIPISHSDPTSLPLEFPPLQVVPTHPFFMEKSLLYHHFPM